MSLEFAVSVPTALSILVLALVAIGFATTADRTVRMFWVGLGFSELLLTLICFVFIPYVAYYTGSSGFVDVVTPIAHSVISAFLALGAGLLMLKGRT